MLFGSCLSATTFVWNGSLTMKRAEMVKIDIKRHQWSRSSSVFPLKHGASAAQHEKTWTSVWDLMIIPWLKRKMQFMVSKITCSKSHTINSCWYLSDQKCRKYGHEAAPVVLLSDKKWRLPTVSHCQKP